MSVVVVGLNHRHASLDLLERLAVSTEQMPKALLSLVQRSNVAEAVVVSTCNRIEIYAAVHRFHGGIGDVREFLYEWGDLTPADLDGLTYEYHDERAASHLFSVACGLDSVVIGEQQVARQVKRAFLTARDERACGSRLSAVFERALRVARRVRTGTRLDHAAASMLDAGIEAAVAKLGPMHDRTVLLIGAGKVGRMAARALESEVGRLLVSNRTPERAQRLAERGATAIPFGDLADGLVDADLIISSTASPDPVITRDVLELVMPLREGRPLVIVDLAVPRDIDGDCRDVDGVTVLDVDAISATVTSAPAADETARARAIVADEVAALMAWRAAQPVEPTITALRRHAEQIRSQEIERLASRLSTLDDRQRATVEQLTRSIVNTLLHEPTVRLKTAPSASDASERADTVRHLFDLND